MPGLLIVTADDLGYDAGASDAILRCFDAGAVTRASALVWMGDSERAAGLARERGLPCGLHLNLSEPLTAERVPDAVRARQAALVPRFDERGRRLRNWVFDPLTARAVARAVHDQVEEFARLFGAPPRHVDGHQHVHVCLNVAAALPAGVSTRRPLRQFEGSRVRRTRDRLVLARHRTSNWLSPIEDASPERLALARDGVLEVMTHPAWDEPHLRAEAWGAAIAGLRRGSFEADL